MVVNIPGGDLSKGETLSQYISSAPGKGSGVHRYVLLLYKQEKKQELEGLTRRKNTSVEGRRQWNAKEIATTYNLELVGANFYNAEYDEYCEIVRKQMGLAWKLINIYNHVNTTYQ